MQARGVDDDDDTDATRLPTTFAIVMQSSCRVCYAGKDCYDTISRRIQLSSVETRPRCPAFNMLESSHA